MLVFIIIGTYPSHGLRGANASTTAKQLKVSTTSRVHATTLSNTKRYRATQTIKNKLGHSRNFTQLYHSRSYFTSRGYCVREISGMITTGYSRYDPGMPTTGRTSSGTPAVKGAIAADPRVIPPGTQVYVPGYGYGVVRDRGSAIKGKILDCCYNSYKEAKQHGRQHVNVLVLKPTQKKVDKK